MAADDFAPPYAPTTYTSNTEAEVYVSEFGDGYEARRTKGLNPHRVTTTLDWQALSAANATTIDTYFRTLEASSFLYTVPGDSQRLWRIDGPWTKGGGHLGPLAASISVTFREVFEP